MNLDELSITPKKRLYHVLLTPQVTSEKQV